MSSLRWAFPLGESVVWNEFFRDGRGECDVCDTDIDGACEGNSRDMH